MNNVYDTIELQDLAKGYVVIKENNETIIEGFNTIVNTGRSFILSKIAKNAFDIPLDPLSTTTKTDYSGYKFYKAYLCEARINDTKIAEVTSPDDEIEKYRAFIGRAQNTKFEKNIRAANTSYDTEKRDIIIKFDISGDYTDAESRVISSIILTIASDNNGTGEAMFSRFTFDPKVITGNALIQINYHIHF